MELGCAFKTAKVFYTRNVMDSTSIDWSYVVLVMLKANLYSRMREMLYFEVNLLFHIQTFHGSESSCTIFSF